MSRTAHFKIGLFIYCLFALASITLLLFAGGFTTSIKAGMAFLDWPLSNGSINPEGWLSESDKFAEHSHRLLGMQIGLIAIGLVLWTSLREARAWVRTLAWALLGDALEVKEGAAATGASDKFGFGHAGTGSLEEVVGEVDGGFEFRFGFNAD